MAKPMGNWCRNMTCSHVGFHHGKIHGMWQNPWEMVGKSWENDGNMWDIEGNIWEYVGTYGNMYAQTVKLQPDKF